MKTKTLLLVGLLALGILAAEPVSAEGPSDCYIGYHEGASIGHADTGEICVVSQSHADLLLNNT